MLRILIVLALICSASYAHAARIEVLPPDANGVAFIGIYGDLALDDEKAFRKAALNIERAVVVFDSNGGNLAAGIGIGRAIRLQEYSTSVSDNGTCASACALAWLGGVQRFLPSSARVGFHLAYTQDNASIL